MGLDPKRHLAYEEAPGSLGDKVGDLVDGLLDTLRALSRPRVMVRV